VKVFSFSLPFLTFILENESEIDIMYTIKFNDALRYNDTINGVKISWVSSIKKDIIQKDDNRVLFRLKKQIETDSILKFNDIVMELFVYTINGELILTKEDVINEIPYYHSYYAPIRIKIDEKNYKKRKREISK
jgi:hypothetical protein